MPDPEPIPITPPVPQSSNEPNDPKIWLLTIGCIGLIGLVATIGIVILAASGHTSDAALGVIAGGAVGGLSGLLAPSPLQNKR